MRVLMFGPSNRSHSHIAAPLAWALQADGHEVLVAGRSDVHEVVDTTGLAAVTVGKPMGEALTAQMNSAEPAAVERSEFRRESQDDYVAPGYEEEITSLVENLFPVMCPPDVTEGLVDIARAWRPDLVVGDMLTPSAVVAARSVGARYARLVLATDAWGQLLAAYRAEHRGDPPALRDWLGAQLEAVGRDYVPADAVGDVSIDLMPPWTYHPEGIDYLSSQHPVFNGPSLVPEWAIEPATSPRVCVSLGNSHQEAGRREMQVSAIFDAVADLEVEVVATLRSQQLVGSTIPPNVRPVDFVSLNHLLPSCDALVHHGGAGTFCAAVRAGVPQSITPSRWWSERFYGPLAMATGLEAEGAGVYAGDDASVTPEMLRDALAVLLDEQTRKRADQLAQEYRALPTLVDTVRHLSRE